MGAIQFSQESYDNDNKRGCDAVCSYLENRGWKCIPKKEDKGIDLHFTKDDREIFVEVEVQHTKGMELKDLNDYKRPTVSTLEKKRKYGTPEKTGKYHIDEVTEIKGWYGDKAWLFECNEDCTQAFIIQMSKMKTDYIWRMAGRGKPEKFIEQPTEDFELVEL